MLRDVSPWQQAVRVQAIPRKRGNGDRAQGQEAAAEESEIDSQVSSWHSTLLVGPAARSGRVTSP